MPPGGNEIHSGVEWPLAVTPPSRTVGSRPWIVAFQNTDGLMDAVIPKAVKPPSALDIKVFRLHEPIV